MPSAHRPKNVFTAGNERQIEFVGVRGLFNLIRHVNGEASKCNSPIVFVDTTGAFVPLRSLILRAFCRGLWCFDIFDNLLYNSRGLYRVKRLLDIALLAKLSRLKIVLSRETLRLFPHAYHLENAAYSVPTDGARDNFDDLICLFAIDGRFDFDLVTQLAALAPETKVYLYGRVSAGKPKLASDLSELCAKRPNIVYQGEYRVADLASILARFAIGFTPYVTNSTLTDFINPDKYYLFLKNGLEVISTDIPQARRMENRVHIARSAHEVLMLMARIKSDPSFQKNTDRGREFDWETRADEFIRLVRSQATSVRADAPCRFGAV